MAQYPIKMLKDENGNPFVPLVAPEAVINTDSETLPQLLSGKISEPATDGTAGQVLTTDGSGGRSWTTVQGGGGGTSDYTALSNKPQINSTTLSGNKSSSDLGLQDALVSGTNIKTINGTSVLGSGNIVTPDSTFIATYGTTTCAELEAAYQANKHIFAINTTSGFMAPLNYRGSSSAFYFGGLYSNAATEFVCLNDTWSSYGITLEERSNRVTSISSSSTNNQYPTALAVKNFAGNLTGYVDTNTVPTMTYATELGAMSWNSTTHEMALTPTAAGWSEGRGILTFGQEVYGLRLSFTFGTATYANLFIKDNNDENVVYLDGSYTSSGGQVELFIPHLDNGAELLFQISGSGTANQVLGYYTIEGMRTLQDLSTIKAYVDIAKRDAEEEIKQECPTQITYIDNDFNDWSYSTTAKLVYVKTGNVVQLFGEFTKFAGSAAAAFTSVPAGWAPGRTVSYYPYDYDFSTDTVNYLNPVSVSTDGSIWMTNDGLGGSRLDGFTYVISPFSGDSGGGVACYTRDTIVCGPTNKTISTLKVGDEVYSYDHNCDEKMVATVTNIATHEGIEQLLKITAGGEEFKCTPEHRLFVVEKPYCEAREIKAGFHIFNADKELVEVESVEQIEENVTGYDIDTTYHNYFVTNNKLLTKTEPITQVFEKEGA